VPKLSWIVGSFNRPGRMRTCLASILDQSFQDFDIVVTDNSDDKACRLDIEYLCQIDPRIRYEWTHDRAMTNTPYPSLYDAAEIGVRMTDSPWLIFPNCDSYYSPRFSEHLLRLAEQNNLQFVVCNFVHGRDNVPYLPKEAHPAICCCDKTACLFRREIFPAEWPGKVDRYPVADGVLAEQLVRSGIRWGRFNPYMVMHN